DDIINYEWNEDSLPNRMPLAQGAKIFLPFSALAGYDDALKKTLIAQQNEKMNLPNPEIECKMEV
ncbi:MAG: hypothetical protein ILP07_09015, partial [Treponema sp.]|nr:hypothetical protein [Treponema sp.]